MGLGSNLGDRTGNLVEAVRRLSDLGADIAVSSLWETAAIGPPQDDYLNAVVAMSTVLGPRPLLEVCLEIERRAGRVRRERWGPRVVDLDLLLYGDAVIDAAGLQVPHPRMHERRFVLEPLAEAWPGVVIPGYGPVDALLAAVRSQGATRVAGQSDWPGPTAS